ncbi:hypothetical protein QBC45DRAFT_425957 [Copromyces sp. CBS 386.78]|nr:hypothetical protein QBC45DRAFT_425957 [Copromyces sp. CBS 386.78]
MVLFDPCCFYGHCEMELQCWVHDRYHDCPGGSGLKAGEMIRRYQEEVGTDEPVTDFEDRVKLYAIRSEIASGGIVRKGESEGDWRAIIEGVKKEMRGLLEKYHGGIEGFERWSNPAQVQNLYTQTEDVEAQMVDGRMVGAKL